MTQQNRHRFTLVKQHFHALLLSADPHRVKFNLYMKGRRPVKGSGFLMDLNVGHEYTSAGIAWRIVVVQFGHLKLQGQGKLKPRRFSSSHDQLTTSAEELVVDQFADTTAWIDINRPRYNQNRNKREQLYILESSLALKNIRFIVSSLGDYYQAIMDDSVLCDFFSNHFEGEIKSDEQRILTKFDIATLT